MGTFQTTFNNSRISDYLTCRAKFKHRWLVKVVSTKKQNFFVFGDALHKFIEFFYRTRDPAIALRQVERVFKEVDRSMMNAEEIHDLECDKACAMGIAESYPLFYKQDFDEFDKFLTEQKFEFPLEGTPYKFFGTIDGLLQDHAGGWWILETKTAAAQTINPGYFERVKIDAQVCGYMEGGKQILGNYPQGIIYNVIKKPSIRLKNGESLVAFQRRVKEEYTKLAKEKNYFQREQILTSKHRQEAWMKDTAFLVTEIAQAMEKGKNTRWPMNTRACNAYFGTCEYMHACVEGVYNKLLYKKDESGK